MPKHMPMFSEFENTHQFMMHFPTYPQNMRMHFNTKDFNIIRHRKWDFDLIFSHLPEHTLNIKNVLYNTSSHNPPIVGYCHWFDIKDVVVSSMHALPYNLIGILEMKRCYLNTEAQKQLVQNIFLLSEDELTSFIELKDKYYIIEILKTEDIQNNLNNTKVANDIKKNLQSLNKRKSMSEIIGKINQNRLQNIVNAGIYIFKREIVDIIQEKSFLSLEKDIFPKLIDDARLKIMGVIENNSFHDFGTPSRYQQIQNNTDVYLQ